MFLHPHLVKHIPHTQATDGPAILGNITVKPHLHSVVSPVMSCFCFFSLGSSGECRLFIPGFWFSSSVEKTECSGTSPASDDEDENYETSFSGRSMLCNRSFASGGRRSAASQLVAISSRCVVFSCVV